MHFLGSVNAMNPWDLIKQRLEGLLSVESFQNWFSRTRFHSMEGLAVRVTVPDAQTKRWLESEYAEQVLSAMRG
jgi:chromosomal replication initiation ATPase DnaA